MTTSLALSSWDSGLVPSVYPNGSTWDLSVVNGDINSVFGPSQIAQDVASAIQLFLGELYYDVTIGLPYLTEVMGQPYAPSVITPLLESAALSVPGVVKAKATITTFQNRQVSGYIDILDSTGQELGVNF
jgi:hypothetical protein